MRSLKKNLIIATLVSALSFVSIPGFLGTSSVEALSGSDFNASRIIDDTVFFAGGNMSASQIQTFLNSKLPSCDTNGDAPRTYTYNGQTVTTSRAVYVQRFGHPAPPYACLKDVVHDSIAKAPDAYCGGATQSARKTSAEIIYDVSVACNVSPKVLLVLLQKEQGLITDDWPWPRQYTAATGFSCPDTAACNPEYAGFFNQVYYAARQYQRYAKQSNSYSYRSGRNNYVQYNPNAGCGGSTIYIENQATAGLYNYTPYQPNQAALNNLYGTGDSCSAYGNRNFWRMFNDWFGSTQTNLVNIAHPDGTLIKPAYSADVFVIENGTRRAVSSPAVLYSNGFTWEKLKIATVNDMEMPLGSPLNTFREGTLIKGSGAGIYSVSDLGDGNFEKHAFADWNTFSGLGYKLSDVIIVTDSELNAIPTGEQINDTTEHSNGTLIQPAGSPNVYLLQDGERRAISSAGAFVSHGYKWDSVKQATTADMAKPLGDTLDYKEGALIKGTAAGIYAVDILINGTYQKRAFGSWEAFAGLGFTFNEVLIVDNSQIPPQNGSTISL